MLDCMTPDSRPQRSAGLIVDLFAGGGGASEGIYQALGRHPDIAINHDEDAIAVHERNHPTTRHFCQSIWKVHPLEAVGDRPVDLLWASPDCRHFSRAAGGRPKWKSVRSLPGVVLTWAKYARPRVIIVENVREMKDWGPLLDDGTPCPRRVGRSFKCWVGRLRGMGYKVEFRELCAADYGVPTIRNRLFIVARCDGLPVKWPQPTHSKSPTMFEGRWRSAAEIIDWSIPCPSIFERKRPLKDATLRRIAEGVMRYVVNAAEPFIVGVGGRMGQSPPRPVSAPVQTVTSKADSAIVVPHISSFYGSSKGASADQPLGAVTAQGEHHALVAAFMAQHNGGANYGHDVRQPVSTIMSGGHHQQVVAATLAPGEVERANRVSAFLIHYYSNGGQMQPLTAPLGAATTKARFGLVTVAGVPIVDISMRMLSRGELQAAQGFRSDYDLTDDGRLSKTSSIRLIGNSVCPGAAAAVVRANVAPAPAELMEAA